MKAKITFLFITSIVFQMLLTRCNNDNNNAEKNEIKTIAISEGLKNSATYKLSDIAKSIKYVQLETNETCLIRRIDRVLMKDSLLFVLSNFEKLLLFNHKGDFIIQIGNKGRGPGEYVAVFDFIINESKKQVVIWDDQSRKTITYSFDGTYIIEKNFDTSFQEIESNKNELSLASYMIRDNVILLIEDEKNNTYKYYKDDLNIPDVKNGYSRAISLYSLNDTLTYWNDTNNNIVRIQGDKIKPIYYFDFGKDQVPVSEMGQNPPDNLGRYIYASSYIETQNLIFINVVNKNKLNRLIYDKQKHEINLVDNELFKDWKFDFAIVNDLDNSIPFWPDNFGRADSKTVYQSFYAHQYRENANEKIATDIKNSTELSEIISNSSEMDNPVLMIVSLK